MSLQPIDQRLTVCNQDGTSKKLRSACDACHRAKVRCSGELTCARCLRDGVACHYSYRAHLGKPKGSLNRKTLEKMRARGEKPPTPRSRHMSMDISSCPPPLPILEENLESIDMNPSVDWGALSNPLLTPSPSYLSMLGGVLNNFNLDEADLNLAGCPTPVDHSGAGSIGDAAMSNDVSSSSPSISGSSVSPSRLSNGANKVNQCSCVRALTSQVSRLHEISGHRSAAGLDDALQCTQETSACVSKFLHCHSCSVEAQIYVLVSVLFSLTLELILPLADSSQENLRRRAPIRIGNYTMSGQLGEALEGAVVHSMIGILDTVMRKFEVKIGFLSTETAHIEFLKSEACRLKRGFEMIAAHTRTDTFQ